MRIVCSCADPLEAELLCHWLNSRGISAIVQGDSLWTARGAIPLTPDTAPSVAVPDEEFDAAQRLLAERDAAPDDEVAADWSCPTCGEALDGRFSSCWKCAAAVPDVDDATEAPIRDEASEPVVSNAVPVDSTPAELGRRAFPWATLTLTVSACVLCWLVERAGGGRSIEALQQFGWRDAIGTWKGNWWSLATSALLHQDASHLALNLLYVLPLGWSIERYFGTARFIALLVGATFVSSALGMSLSGNQGIGASGVSYALLGFCFFAR